MTIAIRFYRNEGLPKGLFSSEIIVTHCKAEIFAF